MPRTVPNHSRRAFLELGCITESVFSREKERDCPCSQVIKGTFVSLDIHRKKWKKFPGGKHSMAYYFGQPWKGV
jgi:hypothetical protein